uniref:Uncharacterized protein n=1 Tax=Aegilops tauschii subsp. strangulata TaxID=200361 RepID=A0A453AQ58_AEGTS
WERERLLRPPCALLCDDSQAAQVQELIAISGVRSIMPSSNVGIVPFACLHNVSLLSYFYSKVCTPPQKKVCTLFFLLFITLHISSQTV